MVNEYKRIFLLKGLQCISDYDFRIVKSLLIHDLQLTKKMQDDYDRIKIADLMEEKFPKDAGLSILIELYQDIPELEDLVDTLRKEKAEGEIFLNVCLSCSWLSCVHFMQKPRLKTVPEQPSQEDGPQKGPKQVMVLKATQLFTFDMRENRMMFHATGATETEFFRVKVCDTVLKKKFIPNNVIVISDYIGHNGFLEICTASSVSDVKGTNMMDIPVSLRQRANATPKINTICLQRVGTFVNGVFSVYAKTVKDEFIYYGIEDNTGKKEVVVHGQFTNMRCEPGDKLRLFCFELSSCVDRWQLRSGRHSYLQVIRARRRDIEPPNPHSAMGMYLNSDINTTEQH